MNKVKLNKIKHTKNEIWAVEDSGQSEQRKLRDPDPSVLTCLNAPRCRDTRCALSTRQSLHLPRLSSQPQPAAPAEVGNDSKEEADGVQSLHSRDTQETAGPLHVCAQRKRWAGRTDPAGQAKSHRSANLSSDRSFSLRPHSGSTTLGPIECNWRHPLPRPHASWVGECSQGPAVNPQENKLSATSSAGMVASLRRSQAFIFATLPFTSHCPSKVGLSSNHLSHLTFWGD